LFEISKFHPQEGINLLNSGDHRNPLIGFPPQMFHYFVSYLGEGRVLNHQKLTQREQKLTGKVPVTHFPLVLTKTLECLLSERSERTDRNLPTATGTIGASVRTIDPHIFGVYRYEATTDQH
jgi:hypothetical protein